jgi:hypothetical protein
VPLPDMAQRILADYMANERAGAAGRAPLFVSRFRAKGAQTVTGRMKGTASGRLRGPSARGRECRSFTRTRSVTRVVSSCSGAVASYAATVAKLSGVIVTEGRSSRNSRTCVCLTRAVMESASTLAGARRGE